MKLNELNNLLEDKNRLESIFEMMDDEDFFLVKKQEENKLSNYLDISNGKLIRTIYNEYKFVDDDKKYYKEELNIKEMRNVLLKRIPVLFEIYLNEVITSEENKVFEDNIKNNKSLIKKISLLNSGFVYEIKDNNEKVYIVPEELKDIYKNTYTEDKLEEILYKKIDASFPLYVKINGIIPQDFLENVFINHYKFNITKEKLREYLKEKLGVYKNYYTIYKDQEEYINEKIIPLKENKKYKVIDEYELIMYASYISETINEILNIIKSDKEEDRINIYKIISSSGITVKDIVNEINSDYNLTKNKVDKLTDLISKKIDNLIVYSTNGYTISEYKKNEIIEFNLMKNKPKNNSFNILIKLISKDALNLLCECYNTPEEYLLESIRESFLEHLESLDEEELYFLNEDYYSDNIETINSEDIENGYIFVYEEDDEIKYIIPTEIQDVLGKYVLENTNASDFIYLILEYLRINGIIEIQKLLEILNNEHNINISYEELISLFNELDIKKIGKYCTIIGDFTIRDINEFTSMKENIGYKIVDLNNLDKFDVLFDELHKYLDNNTNYNEEKVDILIDNVVAGVRQATFNKNMYNAILIEDFNIRLSKNELVNIDNIVNKYKNHIGIWRYNGYTISEYNNLLANRSNSKKLGRNDPCPCGSGIKYKKCCGK